MSAEPSITNVGILGAGTIGSSWATFFVAKGLAVQIYDEHEPTRDGAASRVRENLARMVELGILSTRERDAANERVVVVSTLAEMATAPFIQESIVESYEVKKPVYQELDALTSADAIIASSSSGLLMTELQTVMSRPERALIAHPFNPPHLLPLVELVAGEGTSPEVVDSVRRFFEQLGKVPVVLNKETPGHIANRLAAALWREAIDLVASGVASVEDVDKALHAGPGLRWAIMGQHQIYHLGGGAGGYAHFIEHIGRTFEAYWEGMADWSQIPEEAKTAVLAGIQDAVGDREIAELADERDRKLAALLSVLYPDSEA